MKGDAMSEDTDLILQKLIEKWRKTGLLKNISPEDEEGLVLSLENSIVYLHAKEHSDFVKATLVPAVRRLFPHCNIINLEKLEKILDRLSIDLAKMKDNGYCTLDWECEIVIKSTEEYLKE